MLVRRARPIRFDREAETGRNRPLRIAVVTDDGVEHEVFLKMSGRPELGVEGLANELLAAVLAGDLGLPICEPFLVELSTSWIDAIPDKATQEALRASEPVAFASKAAGRQWKPWAAGDLLTPGREAAALEVFAFDAYIENDDRRVGPNPNCLVDGPHFRIIDHELAFRIRQKLFPAPAPWRAGYLERLTAPDGHIFGAKLKGRELDFNSVRQAWVAISPERLEEYAASMPREWDGAADAMKAALDHLQEVNRRIEECLAELERALG
jgi:hypothetical protein